MKFCKKEKGCLEPNQNQLFIWKTRIIFIFKRTILRASLENPYLIYIYNKWTNPLKIGTRREGRPWGFS
jgi:hypothetical protein